MTLRPSFRYAVLVRKARELHLTVHGKCPTLGDAKYVAERYLKTEAPGAEALIAEITERLTATAVIKTERV